MNLVQNVLREENEGIENEGIEKIIKAVVEHTNYIDDLFNKITVNYLENDDVCSKTRRTTNNSSMHYGNYFLKQIKTEHNYYEREVFYDFLNCNNEHVNKLF